MGRQDSEPAPSAILLKRAYEPVRAGDGVRVLVDRLWPRGISKETAHLDARMKELGPSDALRTWFGHQPDRWDGFAEKYRHELATPMRRLLLAELQSIAGKATLTLVYGARDTEENEAVVLRDYLLQEQAHPGDSYGAATTLLITAVVVAAGHHDTIAPASGLQLFASSLLTAQEFDGAVAELVTAGRLRESSEGWKVTARGRQQVRQLFNPE